MLITVQVPRYVEGKSTFDARQHRSQVGTQLRLLPRSRRTAGGTLDEIGAWIGAYCPLAVDMCWGNMTQLIRPRLVSATAQASQLSTPCIGQGILNGDSAIVDGTRTPNWPF